MAGLLFSQCKVCFVLFCFYNPVWEQEDAWGHLGKPTCVPPKPKESY